MARPHTRRERMWRFRLDDETTLEVSTPPGATEKQVRRRGRVSLALGTVVAALMMVTLAYADNLNDTLAAGSVTNPTINEGAGFNTTINYHVDRTGNNNTSFPATVTFALSGAPSWISLNASSRTFSGYSDVQSITVSGTAPSGSGGTTYNFSVEPSTSASNLNTNPAKVDMSVTVNALSDSTPPVVTPTVVGTLGNNGWYTSDVTVSWTVVDDESSISSTSGCDPTTISADTSGTTLTCTATSAGGTASESVTIKRDATAPTIGGDALPAPNGNGWNNTDVTVSFTCDDTMSGIASCGPDQTLSSEGASQSASGTAVDNAGNSASTTVSGISIDKTPPTVALVGGPADGASYHFGFVPAVPACTASDALSGLDETCTVSGYGTSVGSHTVKATAKDLAGNEASDEHAYTVLAWTLNGFFRPVDMSPSVWNTVKGGSTVPLKFRVFAGSTELTDTSVVASLKSAQVACSGGSEDPVEDLSPTGGTSLRYDTTDGQFIYNWQTPKQAGKCFRVTMTTQDGSSLVAYFKLK